jgi:hypothetical protein
MKNILVFLMFLVVSACSAVTPVPAAVISAATARATGTPKPTATPAATLDAAQVTADSLWVRSDPMGLRIDYLYNSDPVTLTGTCSTDPAGWAEIAWHGGTAWVNASFLSDNKCQTSEGE